MAWISIHEEVNGPKKRLTAKMIGCSRNEVAGMLQSLWLWGIKNADENGYVKLADREDIAQVIAYDLDERLDPQNAAEYLISCGWIDEIDGKLFLHDWAEWQALWYKHQKRKKDDVERKRKVKENTIALQHKPETSPPPKEVKPRDEMLKEEQPKTEKQKKEKPPKVQKVAYAEFVNLEEKQYQKLIELYGQRATDEMIRMLDNYKGSSGKTYKDDYRAIIGWPLERLRDKNPKILKQELAPQTGSCEDGSYFSDWGGVI